MSNIYDWFAWDCEGFKNQFVPFQGIMGTKNGNLWCQKPKKKGETGKKPTTKKPTVGILVYGILTYEFVGNLFLMGTLVGILVEVKIY